MDVLVANWWTSECMFWWEHKEPLKRVDLTMVNIWRSQAAWFDCLATTAAPVIRDSLSVNYSHFGQIFLAFEAICLPEFIAGTQGNYMSTNWVQFCWIWGSGQFFMYVTRSWFCYFLTCMLFKTSTAISCCTLQKQTRCWPSELKN